jgi:hypothetical protein
MVSSEHENHLNKLGGVGRKSTLEPK